jgi:hypothetical protein
MTRLTVDIPDDLANSIAMMAAVRGYETPQMAIELIRSSIVQSEVEKSLEEAKGLSDEDVIAMADLRLSPEENQRLSELLELNSEGAITAEQSAELDDLMQIHNDALLKKSLGWAEAVRRKLRAPISS